MTQEKALENILETFSPLNRAIFIADWLEDINWHTERKMLVDNLPKDWVTKWEILHELSMATKEQQFPITTVEFLKKEGYFSEKAKDVVQRIRQEDRAFYNGHLVSRENIYDYNRTQELYRGLNYIFGWGLENTLPATKGKEMVDWLLTLINKKGDRVN